MLVKLIAAVLAVSDTGSVSTSINTTDLSAQVCETVRVGLMGNDGISTVTLKNGHSVQVITRVQCVPLGVGEVSGPDPRDIFGSFIDGINNMGRMR